MRKVLPLIFSGVAAISFGAFAQTTTTTPSDTKPAEVDRTSKGSPASGSVTTRRSDAAGPNAGASRSDATTGASSDTAADKRKVRKETRDRNASQGSSSGTTGSNPTNANQGGQAGTQAPGTSAAGAPGTVGTQGNPGPGATPHAGSGSAK